MTVLADTANTPSAWSLRAATIPDPWTACGWTYESQCDRFEQIVEALDPQPGDSLLDWGCGTGCLSEYLAEAVRYHGYDFAGGMVDRARDEHPTRRFTVSEPLGPFDLVACVGCFNLPDGWSRERTWHTFRHLWDTMRPRALAASLYAGDDPSCLVYTFDECEKFAAGESYSYRVAQWRPNDILLLLTRGNR